MVQRRNRPNFPKMWFDGTIANLKAEIEGGRSWFGVWAFQGGKPYPVIARRTRIAFDRLVAIEFGAAITRDELERLCRLWEIDAARVEATLPAGAVVKIISPYLQTD